MKNSSDPSFPGAIRALFAFFCCSCLFILALGYAWSSFQKQSQAMTVAPIAAATAERVSVAEPQKLEAASQMAVATESRDAASAHALVGTPNDTVATLVPANLVGPVAAVGRMNTAPTTAGKMMLVSLPAPKDHQEGSDQKSVKNPHIAIIIDDMGLAIKNSHRATDLPAPVTLSYLPYAENIQSQVDTARAKGHEIMLHLPMEAFDRAMYPGPAALTTRLSMDELKQRLVTNLTAFHGYVGINNHMGSRLTSTPEAMQVVMDEIGRRDVYFVDSWTSPRSVAYETAAEEGISRARRDVFLDHDEGEQAVWNALKQAEYMARRYGSSIVIGHPKNDTINVLQAWLPGAAERGVQIVPASTLVYNGPTSRDPVLMADAARRQKHMAQTMARLTPASGK